LGSGGVDAVALARLRATGRPPPLSGLGGLSGLLALTSGLAALGAQGGDRERRRRGCAASGLLDAGDRQSVRRSVGSARGLRLPYARGPVAREVHERDAQRCDRADQERSGGDGENGGDAATRTASRLRWRLVARSDSDR